MPQTCVLHSSVCVDFDLDLILTTINTAKSKNTTPPTISPTMAPVLRIGVFGCGCGVCCGSSPADCFASMLVGVIAFIYIRVRLQVLLLDELSTP